MGAGGGNPLAGTGALSLYNSQNQPSGGQSPSGGQGSKGGQQGTGVKGGSYTPRQDIRKYRPFDTSMIPDYNQGFSQKNFDIAKNVSRANDLYESGDIDGAHNIMRQYDLNQLQGPSMGQGGGYGGGGSGEGNYPSPSRRTMPQMGRGGKGGYQPMPFRQPRQLGPIPQFRSQPPMQQPRFPQPGFGGFPQQRPNPYMGGLGSMGGMGIPYFNQDMMRQRFGGQMPYNAVGDMPGYNIGQMPGMGAPGSQPPPTMSLQERLDQLQQGVQTMDMNPEYGGLSSSVGQGLKNMGFTATQIKEHGNDLFAGNIQPEGIAKQPSGTSDYRSPRNLLGMPTFNEGLDDFLAFYDRQKNPSQNEAPPGSGGSGIPPQNLTDPDAPTYKDTDVSSALKFATGINADPTPEDIARYDIDGDGQINISDVTGIKGRLDNQLEQRAEQAQRVSPSDMQRQQMMNQMMQQRMMQQRMMQQMMNPLMQQRMNPYMQMPMQDPRMMNQFRLPGQFGMMNPYMQQRQSPFSSIMSRFNQRPTGGITSIPKSTTTTPGGPGDDR